jgi:hypothetical protein
MEPALASISNQHGQQGGQFIAMHRQALDILREQEPLIVEPPLQVRQKLYKTAIGKWRTYEEHLRPMAADLQPLIEQYEATYGGGNTHDEL